MTNTGDDSAGRELRFIVDHNVGKLVRWLRMLGYDSLFFTGQDDGLMVKTALAEDRYILTRDGGIMHRKVVKTGRIKAVLLESETPEKQMRQLVDSLPLQKQARPFTLCIECNCPLIARKRDEVADRIPPHVFKTQTQYMECPACRRIYWRGTHWEAMRRKLRNSRLITEELPVELKGSARTS